MDKEKLLMLERLFSTLKVQKIEYITEKTVLFNFEKNVRLFIDSNENGVEFSLLSVSEEGDKAIESIDIV